MADNILRLRVDSTEYDNKIKRAADGIQQYAQKCREAGGTLSFLDDGVLEFVQSLGQMDTVARGSRQQMRELSNALTTLTTTYRGLTEEEKNSPFGVELARGIDALTERAGEARDAMSDVEQSIRNASSDTRTFDQVAQGMSVATAGFQGLTGAGKLLGIEMGNDVEVIAKLQAAMAVTNSLTTIQTALQKQSALMQGLNAAKTALATVSQQAYAVATGEATVAQTAFNVVASANPYALLLTAAGALVGVIAAFASTTGESTDALAEQKSMIDDLAKSVDTAAESYKNLAAQIKSLGIGGQKEYKILIQAKADQFQDVRNAWLNVGFDKRKEEERNGRDTEKWKALDEEQKRLHEEMLKIQKEYNELRRVNKERVKRLNQYARLDFSDITTESEAQSALSFLQDQKKYKEPTSRDYGNIKRAIEYVENILLPQFQDKTTTNVNHKTTTTTKSLKEAKDKIVTGSMADLMNDLKYLQQEQTKATNTKEWEAYQDAIRATQMQIKELKGELKDVPASISDVAESTNKATDTQNKKIQDRLNDPATVSKGMAEVVKQIERDQNKDDKKEKKYLSEGISQLGGGLGGIQNGFKQLGVDLGSGFNDVVSGLQGISTILTAIQTIVAAIQVIAGVDALIPFANGGIVKAAGGTLVGNSFSGDNLRAIGPGGQIYGLNAGEIVLNRAQAGVLASELSTPGFTNMRLETYVSGRDLKIVLNNDSESRGKGRYLTSVNYKG